MPSRVPLVLALLPALLVPAALVAQTKTPPRVARFLAVGDSPPFRQEIRDGVRYELEAPAGSLPPPEIRAATAPAADSGSPPPAPAEVPAASLRLGLVSGPVVVPGGSAPLQLRDAAAGAEAPPWLTLRQPEAGDFLVLLWRPPGADTWSEVSHLVLPDGPLGSPAGTVRIVNLFAQPVRITWAGESILLRPSRHETRRVTPPSETPFQIAAADAAGIQRRYFATTLTHNPGERGWIVLYRADGESPRRPLKVLTLREPAPPAAPPTGR